MGGFILVKHNGIPLQELHESYKNALSVFTNRGQSIKNEIHDNTFWLVLFDFYHNNCNYLPYHKEGQIAALCGTCFYKGLTGNEALDAIYIDFSKKELNFSLIEGSYVIVIKHNDQLILFNDLIGNYRVYKDVSNSIFSSSFLSVSSVIDTTISEQEVYEYIFNGAFYGNKTIYKEIELLDTNFIWELNPSVSKITRPEPDFISLKNLTSEEQTEVVSKNLISYFEIVQKAFKNNITSALSGGYDSRLMLGLMRTVGITPNLYVYGSKNSADVKVAKNIALNEGLNIDWIDKSDTAKIEREEFEQFIEINFLRFDGFHNIGVFTEETEMATRLMRTAKSSLQINGGGGEIYRNFWKLPDNEITAQKFIKNKYDFADYKKLTTKAFNKNDYFETLTVKALSSAGNSSKNLSRKEIDLLYPMFRLKYWMGLNNLINNQLAHTLTPFSEARFIFQSLEIPIKAKNLGAFEAGLIRKIDPKLAAYMSSYGYNFTDTTKLKHKLKNNLLLNLPIFIKPYLRRFKRLRKNQYMPYYLQKSYINKIFGEKELEIEEFIHLNNLNDAEMLSRSLTIQLHLSKKFLRE